MSFVSISLAEYLELHLANNPTENRDDLRKRLEQALLDSRNGVKCGCGNNLWVIGSASVGNSCFTCITGESQPSGDYELAEAIHQRPPKANRGRHIDDMDPSEISGIFDDDGYEIPFHSIRKPSLCLLCRKDDLPEEEILCQLTRADQEDRDEFVCHDFEKR